MKKFIIVLVSIVPGFLASLVFILGASPFEVQGQNSNSVKTGDHGSLMTPTRSVGSSTLSFRGVTPE